MDKSVRLSEDAALHAIAECMKSETGEHFFLSLARQLALVLNCRYAFVAELSEDRLRFRTRAVWADDRYLDNFESPLAGTPCEEVLKGRARYREATDTLPQPESLTTVEALTSCRVLVDDTWEIYHLLLR